MKFPELEKLLNFLKLIKHIDIFEKKTHLIQGQTLHMRSKDKQISPKSSKFVEIRQN